MQFFFLTVETCQKFSFSAIRMKIKWAGMADQLKCMEFLWWFDTKIFPVSLKLNICQSNYFTCLQNLTEWQTNKTNKLLYSIINNEFVSQKIRHWNISSKLNRVCVLSYGCCGCDYHPIAYFDGIRNRQQSNSCDSKASQTHDFTVKSQCIPICDGMYMNLDRTVTKPFLLSHLVGIFLYLILTGYRRIKWVVKVHSGLVSIFYQFKYVGLCTIKIS